MGEMREWDVELSRDVIEIDTAVVRVKAETQQAAESLALEQVKKGTDVKSHTAEVTPWEIDGIEEVKEGE